MENIELELRTTSKLMERAFFLVLFACCRDSYVTNQV